MRVLGLGLGALPVASVLWEHGAGWLPWTLLVANALAWPHLAWLNARRQAEPRRAERLHLLVDAAAVGVWIAVMRIDLVPSAVMASLVNADKLGVGGWKLVLRSVSAMLVAGLATWAALGFPFEPHSSTATVLWCMPLLFAYPLAISLALYTVTRRAREQNRQLERLNRSDALTGLPNRRHWDQAVATEYARHLRTGRPTTLLLLDVDNFKEVNDRHGHACGDGVLRTLATVLRESVREIDVVARHGGDEFAVLLAETDVRGAHEVAERIRLAFNARRGARAEAERCTLSIGLCEVDRAVGSVESWIERADAAMYRAKHSGRDRVVADDTRSRASLSPGPAP